MNVPDDVYAQLRAVAAACLKHERRDHTHQATSLANEAFLRLDARVLGLERVELVRLAARVMRQVLVDHARKRAALKRGGEGGREVFDPEAMIDHRSPEHVLAVHEALERLHEIDPSLAEIVELRTFGGLSESEAAAQLGVSGRTVSRRWRIAKMYLARELGRRGDDR